MGKNWILSIIPIHAKTSIFMFIIICMEAYQNIIKIYHLLN
ncbi:hypothetical protein [uncultured Gammaproteobacteria bacterium]|nr:hypothetical protein [uncultured Gammaproteobacteria bacterium]